MNLLLLWTRPLRRIAVLYSILMAQASPAADEPNPVDEATPVEELAASTAEVDSLVAPVALYPDPLLAQVLAASTYPAEIAAAYRWTKLKPGLTPIELMKGAARQNSDPSVQALVVFPCVLRVMAENSKWTTALGNALLIRQEAVLASVQRLRQKAYQAGVLRSNDRHIATPWTVGTQSIITIEPAIPGMVYVPIYDPAVVFGRPSGSALYTASPNSPRPASGTGIPGDGIAFDSGLAVGSVFSGCCGSRWNWAWNCQWGSNSGIYLNHDFISRYGFRSFPERNAHGTSPWEHNPYYRGNLPYPNSAVRNRYRNARTARGQVHAHTHAADRTAKVVARPARARTLGSPNPRGSAARMEMLDPPAPPPPPKNRKPSPFGDDGVGDQGRKARQSGVRNRGSAGH
jgi:hypothetical protein